MYFFYFYHQLLYISSVVLRLANPPIGQLYKRGRETRANKCIRRLSLNVWSNWPTDIISRWGEALSLSLTNGTILFPGNVNVTCAQNSVYSVYNTVSSFKTKWSNYTSHIRSGNKLIKRSSYWSRPTRNQPSRELLFVLKWYEMWVI